MTPPAAQGLLESETTAWRDDPESDVVWVGRHEGRWGLRMRQTVREATTNWFDVGSRTVALEAYLLPAPPVDAAAAYRLCLARNRRAWPATTYVDDRGDIFIGARIRLSEFGSRTLSQAVAATYLLVESTFRPLLQAGFAPREKTS